MSASPDESGAVMAPDVPKEDAGISPNASNLLQHPHTHPIALDMLYLRKYGPDWLRWEPETVMLRSRAELKQEISRLNMHKLMACKALHMVDTYWRQWEIFLWCTSAFNGVPPDFDVMQVPTAAQVLLSVSTANRIRNDVPWAEELRSYLSVVFTHDGVFCPLPPCDFVEVRGSDYGVDCDEVAAAYRRFRDSGVESKSLIIAEQVRKRVTLQDILSADDLALEAQLRMVEYVR